MAKQAVTKKAETKAKTKAKKKVKTISKKANPSTYKVQVGDKIPDFRASATSGKTIQLKEFKGKKLVLYFYPKDSTPGCTLEGQDFAKLLKDFKKAGAEVVGVSRDSIASHEKFREKCGFPFELISDGEEEVCRLFDVIQMKKLYGRSFEGIERSTFILSEDGRVACEWRKVKVDGHAQEVLEALRALKK